MNTRRDFLRKTALGASAALLSPSLSSLFAEEPAGHHPNGPLKRIVFFLQNQGFEAKTCIPDGVNSGGSLAKAKLPEPIEALEPYKERLHIINGLHGLHTNPNHSAYFGALGGNRGGNGTPPGASTIDYVLSTLLPQTLLPHLCIGMDSMEDMTTRPTIANLSASGAGQPIFMYSNPNHLYGLLYGGIAVGDMRKQFEARSNINERIEALAAAKGVALPGTDQQRYAHYVEGFRDINALRSRLNGVSDHLRKFAPKVDERYSSPKFETDWHDTLLDLGISALASGITNTLTIGSGRGHVQGAWKGLGIEEQGHGLGHMTQAGNPIWIKIRQYNCRMLVRIMQALERVPEGRGTMMDHTLIVYTSNGADGQHTKGGNWPFMLLGNCGGMFKSGFVTQIRNRPINALYTTLLRAAGKQVDRFNMTEQLAKQFDSGTGPLKEVLA